VDKEKGMTRKRFLEILLTAVISAGIAFLQSLLTHIDPGQLISQTTLTAGGIGATIHTARSLPLA
jgi:hypothetical protein